jgi:hypothetical protein
MRYPKTDVAREDYLPHKNCGHFLIAKDGDIARERAMRCIAMLSKRLSAPINNTAVQTIPNNYVSRMQPLCNSSSDHRYSTK